MAKTQEEPKDAKNKKSKEAKEKNGNALVGRVKKAVKKSRRKLGEEKFEKELQRTIAFLEELRHKVSESPAKHSEETAEPATEKQDKRNKPSGKKAVDKKTEKKNKARKAKSKSVAPSE